MVYDNGYNCLYVCKSIKLTCMCTPEYCGVAMCLTASVSVVAILVSDIIIIIYRKNTIEQAMPSVLILWGHI